jgi:hypothetical protein
MKKFIKLGLLSSLLLSSSSFAFNEPHGFYFGLLGEVSHGPSEQNIHIPYYGINHDAQVKFSYISGGGGAALGYKYSHFRGEVEILYNSISTGPVKLPGCTIQNMDVATPTGACPSELVTKGVGFKGTSTAVYGLFNVYFDIFGTENPSDVFPYLGLGAGVVSINNSNEFIATLTTNETSRSINNTLTSSAAQAILGVGYLIDDYTWIDMDLRYVTTKALPEFDNRRYSLYTINFGVNGSFDRSTS